MNFDESTAKYGVAKAVITSRDGFVEITAAGVSCTAYAGGLAACVVGDKVFCDFGTYAAVWTLEELVGLSFDRG